jgi:hypothetical protein
MEGCRQNVLNLAKWEASLTAHKLIKQSSYDENWTTVKLNDGRTYPYGFAWDVTAKDGHRVVGHDGAWQGFTMEIMRCVDHRLTVIVMTNLDSDSSQPEEIFEDVTSIYLKWSQT